MTQGHQPLVISGRGGRDTPLLLIATALVALTVAVYLPAKNNEFVSYDDPYYIMENVHVLQGLSWDNVRWAMTSFEVGNWHPLTWLSHMADVHFLNTKPGRHHVVNIAIHALNALLLFLLLNRMTGAVWRSALVAALFAVHPLNVESVAWISERKNVLSTLFWFLTMWSYVTYVRRPSIKTYFEVLVVFALGLMAKPMLVTLPLVLLLVDYWPLGRMSFTALDGTPNTGVLPQQKSFLWLIREKAPLLMLSAIASLITIKAQTGATASLHALPWSVRISNALLSYGAYVYRMFWPLKLAVIYPHPGIYSNSDLNVVGWKAAGTVLLLGTVTIGVLRVRSRPYLLVGWLWFLGTLVPVIGIFQVGLQANADRYAYVPLIGLFVMLAWGLADAVPTMIFARRTVAVAALALVTMLSLATRKQIGYWHDSVALFQHALDVTDNNYVAHLTMALFLEGKNDTGGAIDHCRMALAINPRGSSAYSEMGRLKLKLGKSEEAEYFLRRSLEFPNSDDEYAKAHERLAFILDKRGELQSAEREYKEAIRLDPSNAYFPRLNLALILAKQHRYDEAGQLYAGLLQEAPEASVYFLLGSAREQQGKTQDAIDAYTKTLQLQPEYGPAKKRLEALTKATNLVGAPDAINAKARAN